MRHRRHIRTESSPIPSRPSETRRELESTPPPLHSTYRPLCSYSHSVEAPSHVAETENADEMLLDSRTLQLRPGWRLQACPSIPSANSNRPNFTLELPRSKRKKPCFKKNPAAFELPCWPRSSSHLIRTDRAARARSHARVDSAARARRNRSSSRSSLAAAKCKLQQRARVIVLFSPVFAPETNPRTPTAPKCSPKTEPGPSARTAHPTAPTKTRSTPSAPPRKHTSSTFSFCQRNCGAQGAP